MTNTLAARAETFLPLRSQAEVPQPDSSRSEVPPARVAVAKVPATPQSTRTPVGGSPAPAPRARIPLPWIERDRRAFGADRLSYHVELRCRDPWTGLTAFAQACGAAGLTLKALRCGAEGWVTCVLHETGAADLAHLDRVFAGSEAISLIRWTTEIAVERARGADHEAGATRAAPRTAASV